MPGPVVSGKVIGKKLRWTISASESVAAFSTATACTSSSSVRCSRRQAVDGDEQPAAEPDHRQRHAEEREHVSPDQHGDDEDEPAVDRHLARQAPRHDAVGAHGRDEHRRGAQRVDDRQQRDGDQHQRPQEPLGVGQLLGLPARSGTHGIVVPSQRSHSRPLLDSSTAIGRVPGNSDNTIVRIAVIGTARNAPGTPQSSDHTARLTRIANGLRFSELPIT